MDKVGWRERNRPRPRDKQTSDESGNQIFDETMFGMKEGAGLRAQTHKLEQDAIVLKVDLSLLEWRSRSYEV